VNERLLVASLNALERAESIERSLLAGLPDAIARFDERSRYLYANAAELETLPGTGLTLERCLGCTHAELGVPAQVAGQWSSLLTTCFGTGAASDTLLRLDEEPARFVLVRAFVQAEDEPPTRSVVAVSRDVSESLRYHDALAHAAEAKLRQREAEELLARERALRAAVEDLTRRQRALLLALPDDVLVIDDAGGVRHVVQAADPAARERPRPALETALVAAKESLACAVARAHASGAVQRLPLEASHPGEPAFELRIAPLEDGDALCVARDATELALLRAQLAFSDRLAAMGTVAASVAHEVNNPLAALSLAAELLIQELDVPSQASLARDIFDSAQRIRTIVLELRLFSRRDVGEPERVDMDAVIRSSLKLVRSHFDAGVAPTYHASAVSPVLGSASALVQVFVNLLVNAAHALRASGARRVEVRLYEDAEGVHAVVADSGNGLSEQARAHLFDAFFTTRAANGGTGLGLYVSHGIVTSMGGRLFADEGLEGGCALHIVLPPARESATHTTAPPPVSGISASRVRVLVIDDDQLLLHLYPRLLPGHDVCLASSGDEALRLLETDQRFDAVLCDLRMPVLSGTEVYAIIAARWPALARRFAIVTGGGVDASALAGLDAIGVPVLAKPFGIAQLEGLLVSFAGGVASRAEGRALGAAGGGLGAAWERPARRGGARRVSNRARQGRRGGLQRRRQHALAAEIEAVPVAIGRLREHGHVIELVDEHAVTLDAHVRGGARHRLDAE
jgi:signal transduction histidine kinase